VPKTLAGIEVYLVHVESEQCNGCADCAILCPTGVFDVFQKATVVRPRACLGCGTCVAVCKTNAVIVTEI